MGTPSVCIYTMIYYCYHEICILLAKYKRYLILYKRLIDNGCGLGLLLPWVINDWSKEVNFLDSTIEINELGCIKT
ncbi:hypothetical protein ACHAWF_011373 [Thalassiosira exigua]